MPVRISYEGNFEDAARLMSHAKQELARLDARLETTGLDSGKFLAGYPYLNGYVYGIVLPGGMKHIHVVTSPGVEPTLEFEETEIAFPDFLSGWAIDGRYETDPETGRSAVRDFNATAGCAAVHHEEVSAGSNRVERLAIDVGPGFGDYFPPRGPLPRSQVDLLYPTCYSGTMKKWIQLMLGFGKKPDQTSVYDEIDPQIDPPDPPETLTAWQQKLVDEGMRVWYDFRFSRTHGIHWAGDGKPWLVEISMNRGIVAMPLPIDKRTTTTEFREKVENLGDAEGLEAIDDFGGYPTGEPFPSTGALWDAYVRAGRIIELSPPSGVSDFYQHLWYSSAMGWAFNDRGDEAHNTAYKYGDDGVQVGVHYAAQMQIGATADMTEIDEHDELRSLLDGMSADATRKATFEAVMWKIGRFTKEQCDTYSLRLNSERTTDIYDEIEALELGGLASGTASFTMAGTGNLWWPTKFQPQIKFYEPTLGYLLSHDLRPDRVDAPRDPYCDTTVHVFFAGNELKWAKYFLDPRTVTGGWGGDDEFTAQNSPQGHFERYYRRGATGVSAQYYTNDVDAREEQPESEDRYTFDGESRGYRQRHFTVDHYAEPPANFGAGDKLWCRLKLFHKTRTSRYDKIRQSAAAVVVPAWFRESMFVARNEFDYQRDGYDFWGWQGVVDPNYGLEYVGDGDNKVDVLSYSNLDSVSELYALTKPFADEGQWCNVGDEVIFDGGMPPSTEGDATPIPGFTTRTLTVTMISASEHSPKVVKTETRTGDAASLWSPKWFVPSPHPDYGDTQYHHATMNSYGSSNALIVLNDLDGTENVTYGSPQDSAFLNRLPVFVGVANG